MKTSDALLSAWEATLVQKVDKPAIFDTRGDVLRTFGDIETRTRRFQSAMQDCARGQVYPIDLGNHPDWPAVLLACLREKLVALPLDEAMEPEQRRAAIQICNARGPGTWSGESPALIKLTSGTTAAPRGICFRSEQLIADCNQICNTMGIGETSVNFGVIPVSHSYGLNNLITPLIARGVPMVLSRDRMPRAVLDDLARTNATVFPGMPVFYQAFSEMREPPPLPHLRLCISAGAPLPLTVAQKFRARYGLAIHSFYGSSECGGICYDREAPLLEQGFVGQPMEGVTVDLLDSDPGMSRIRVRSAAVGDGYWPDSEPAKLGAGCFIPDDLLATTANGYRIAGRLSDVINVAGKKVSPSEVEAVLLGFDGVREAVAFGRNSALRNEEVAACIVAEPGIIESELLDFCRGRLSGWQVPKRLFFVGEIPVTDRGKVSRRSLAERFADR